MSEKHMHSRSKSTLRGWKVCHFVLPCSVYVLGVVQNVDSKADRASVLYANAFAEGSFKVSVPTLWTKKPKQRSREQEGVGEGSRERLVSWLEARSGCHAPQQTPCPSRPPPPHQSDLPHAMLAHLKACPFCLPLRARPVRPFGLRLFWSCLRLQVRWTVRWDCSGSFPVSKSACRSRCGKKQRRERQQEKRSMCARRWNSQKNVCFAMYWGSKGSKSKLAKAADGATSNWSPLENNLKSNLPFVGPNTKN